MSLLLACFIFFASCLVLNVAFPLCSGFGFVFFPFWSQKLEVLGLAGALLVCFRSNAGEPGEICSLHLTLSNLKSPQQRGLPLCHLRNGLTVEQTSLFGVLPLLPGKSIAENLP